MNNLTNLAVAAAVIVAGVVVLRTGRALGGALDTVVDLNLDPVDPDNEIAQITDRWTRRLSGRQVDRFGQPLTLGAWLSEAFGD